jgi:hypothetical protein
MGCNNINQHNILWCPTRNKKAVAHENYSNGRPSCVISDACARVIFAVVVVVRRGASRLSSMLKVAPCSWEGNFKTFA